MPRRRPASFHPVEKKPPSEFENPVSGFETAFSSFESEDPKPESRFAGFTERFCKLEKPSSSFAKPFSKFAKPFGKFEKRFSKFEKSFGKFENGFSNPENGIFGPKALFSPFRAFPWSKIATFQGCGRPAGKSFQVIASPRPAAVPVAMHPKPERPRLARDLPRRRILRLDA